MTTTKEATYKLSLSGGGIKIDRAVSAEVAQRIVLLAMGGTPDGIGSGTPGQAGTPPLPPAGNQLSPTTKVKDFLAGKKPNSEVERVACFAYFLAHRMNTDSFKTAQLTKLNTEAAAPRMSNPSYTARNAVTQGYLAPAGGGKKQITSRGEALVTALPDRAAVKAALDANPIPKRKRAPAKKARTKK